MFRTKSKFLAAAAAGDIALLDDYLKKDPYWAEAADRFGDYALHVAAKAGQLGTVKYLMEKQPKLVTALNKQVRPPLTTAILAGQADVVRMLMADKRVLDQINRADGTKITPLQHAIRKNNPEILRMLLESGKADLNYNAPAVYYAVSQRAGDCIDTLLEFQANPNTPLVKTNYSGWMGHDETRSSALALAMQLDETEIALKLLAAGARPEDGEMPLAEAAKKGNLVLAQALLENGIRVNQRDRDTGTALHAAVRAQQMDMVRYLLDNKADKNTTDGAGQTPLNIAQQFALKDMADLLQETAPAGKRIEVKRPSLPPVKPAEAAPALPQDAGDWQRAGAHGVARIETFTNLGRRLTHIFNFETRERLVISENLLTRAEAIGPSESFDHLPEAPVAEALRHFQRLGGTIAADDVLKTKLPKNKVGIRAP